MEEATFVVGDVHGHRDELIDALRAHGLVDDADDWAGGAAHLWFLGDFVDRGPDGVAAIDLVRKLQGQAERQGGFVQSLLGNHEILLLGMHRFADTPVSPGAGTRSFARSWALNGGRLADQDALTAEHIEWLTALPAVALVGEHLLVHSDTLEYLEWGEDVRTINAAVRAILAGTDIEQWWEVWRRLTSRFAFRGGEGGHAAATLLDRLGGAQVVHGHSVIADQLGVHPVDIEGPLLYADGRALGVDAGVFAGGPCLVVRLPWDPPERG